ncbi:TPA: hypothetical protein N0F65_008588 [Lagenidium giganteum]|uniref:Uncharacterized protein n=1 Tax=Lagenidium giganteum TaxID=4803 RepID=A0AAV2YXW9_9STRA|nr:TPA: hypothetical protein N0F65_008588 [Lagenidium giganteum]
MGSGYRRWRDGKTNLEVSIYPYFEKYGVYEFKMVKIKQYEVADRSQLLAYETLWMNKFKKTCVTKISAFSPMKIQRRKEAQKEY